MKASKPVRYLCQAALALGSVLAAGIPAHGQGRVPGYPDSIDAYDPREVAMLPRYCIYTQSFRERVPGGDNPDEIKRWYSVMGDTFHAMHHYCWGLMRTNRAVILTRNRQDRLSYLHSSIGEFDYVIQHAPPDFILLPEILTKKGENLIRLGKAPLGMLEFKRAIELKPDYWPPYAYLSDYYRDTGDLAKAREWLEKGLSLSPDTKALRNRLVELDAVKDKRKTARQPGTPQQPVKP